MATPEDVLVEVCEEDFVRGLDELVPSVSQGELEHYQSVRALFEGKLRKEEEKVGGRSMEGEGRVHGLVEEEEEKDVTLGMNRSMKGKGKEVVR